MADILHDFSIEASPDRVFQAVSTPEQLGRWWTKRSRGQPTEGAEYGLWFGPEYDWRATVTRCIPESEFELALICADDDWLGTRVGFALIVQPTEPRNSSTMQVGPSRPNTIASRVTVGPCTSGYSGGISNTAKQFRMKSAWMCNRGAARSGTLWEVVGCVTGGDAVSDHPVV